MGSLGTVSFGADTGGANYKYDEEVPQAYEQMSDAQQTTANRIGTTHDSNMIVYNSPTFDLGGATASFDLEYSPNAGSSSAPANDGGSATANDNYGSGVGVGVTLAYDALKVGVYAAELERNQTHATSAHDGFEGTWYANYSIGPVSIGYTQSYMDSGTDGTAEAATTAKDAASANTRTANGYFKGDQMSIAFNVNENLSVSYTESEETYDAQSGPGLAGAAAIADVTQKVDGVQIAYSMGAMSIKAYRLDVENPNFDEDASDRTATEIALGLAF